MEEVIHQSQMVNHGKGGVVNVKEGGVCDNSLRGPKRGSSMCSSYLNQRTKLTK